MITDDEIAAGLRAAVGQVNHFAHVAQHRGLFVQLTATNEPGRAISDVCVMRPVTPAEVPMRAPDVPITDEHLQALETAIGAFGVELARPLNQLLTALRLNRATASIPKSGTEPVGFV